MNHELPDIQAGFRKGRGTRDQIANIHWIIEKAREFQKNIYFCFIDYAKAFELWITTNWKILQEMGIPDNLTCLLRNLYAGQETTVRIGHGTMDFFVKVPCTAPMLLVLLNKTITNGTVNDLALLLAFSGGVLTPFIGVGMIGGYTLSKQIRSYKMYLKKISGFALIFFGLWIMI